jgi:hypothetical protein
MPPKRRREDAAEGQGRKTRSRAGTGRRESDSGGAKAHRLRLPKARIRGVPLPTSIHDAGTGSGDAGAEAADAAADGAAAPAERQPAERQPAEHEPDETAVSVAGAAAPAERQPDVSAERVAGAAARAEREPAERVTGAGAGEGAHDDPAEPVAKAVGMVALAARAEDTPVAGMELDLPPAAAAPAAAAQVAGMQAGLPPAAPAPAAPAQVASMAGKRAAAAGRGQVVASKRASRPPDEEEQRKLDSLLRARVVDSDSDDDFVSDEDIIASSASRLPRPDALKAFRKRRLKSSLAEMRRLDKEAEDEAAEMGLLMPRTLLALKALRAAAVAQGGGDQVTSARIKSSVETQRQRVAVRCSKCHGVGHNKRSVKCPKFGRQ